MSEDKLINTKAQVVDNQTATDFLKFCQNVHAGLDEKQKGKFVSAMEEFRAGKTTRREFFKEIVNVAGSKLVLESLSSVNQ